jgi:hypothetical protein
MEEGGKRGSHHNDGIMEELILSSFIITKGRKA